MHITRVCMAVKYLNEMRYFTEHNLKRIPGNLFSGKYRLSILVSNKMKKAAMKQVLLEQDNMRVLSRAYVTREEDPRKIELEPDPLPSFLRMKKAKRDALSGKDGSMIPHTHADQFYSHIKNDRKWE